MGPPDSNQGLTDYEENEARDTPESLGYIFAWKSQ